MRIASRAARSVLVALLSLCALALTNSLALAATVATVVNFSPQGTVKQVRQVTARFSQAMVPLGDPRVSLSPFVVDCPLKGSARWIDSFTWSYDFVVDLPAGVRCAFTLRPGLKTLAGATFAATTAFTFDTGGPSVVESRPWSGSDSIDEQQAFVLMLDTEPDESTIVDHVSFSVEGVTQRIGATIMRGADHDLLAKRFARAISNRPFVILEAKQHFANDAAVHLIWGKGIKSKSGVPSAENQEIDYKVRKAFAARVKCQRENPKAGCIPVTPIQLHFTAPIMPGVARAIVMVAPDGTRIAPKIEGESSVQDVEFEAPFGESATYRIELPANLTDESGRTLIDQSRFPYAVATGEFPPLAKFSARFGIIESVDPVLPVTVRNLEAMIHGGELKLGSNSSGGAIGNLVTRLEGVLWRVPVPDAKSALEWLNRVALAKRSSSVFGPTAAAGQRSFAIPKPNGANAFEVMGLTLKHSGLYIVELRSQRLGSVLLGGGKTMFVPTAALVTDLAVHFKQGKANSLIWVTALESAEPVARADVAISDCHGNQLFSGRTDTRGIALVPHLAAIDNPPQCDQNQSDAEHGGDYYSDQVAPLRDLGGGLLVTAAHGDDFSFVHSSWKNGIEAWRFNLPTDFQPTPYLAHTVFDRTLLRAGETVHMKHFIRSRTLDGFGLPRADRMPDTVSIRFEGGDQHYDLPLNWGSDGAAETDWKIPADAKLGEYQVVMTRRSGATPTPAANPDFDATSSEVQSGVFQVEEFRVPLMRAAIRMPPRPLPGASQITVDVSADYLSGGAAKGLPVVLRSQISPSPFPSFPDFDAFTFVNGPVKEGIRKFEYDEGSNETEENPKVHQREDLVLDAAGGARSTITAIPRADVPQDVRAEMEFRDPNGETQTVANTVTIWPSILLVGIRTEDWASSPGVVQAKIAVVDNAGKPVAHVPVHVIVLSSKFYTYRKRLIGGFYAYENTQEVKRVGALCDGLSDGRGLFLCQGKPGFTGEAVLEAFVSDSAGNASVANTSVYVHGAGRMWFAGEDNDRMDVIAERPEYQPGDVARFQVRMPYARATALVTVEREGIIASSVLHLSGDNPLITLPVRDYAPNVFVSVMAVRGRIAGIAPTATVDLGKPSFKLGIAGIRVGWRDHRLKVRVTPERTVYHVRDRARVKLAVRDPGDRPPPPSSKVTVAVVDEGLLELKPNDSWKLLEAMMDQRPYQVETSTAEMQVVGRRHYGLKALPPGGGGGQHVTRELFNTLLLWRATVPLDSNGDAEVEVPLNDSLTSFRIVAIAATGVGDFGTGAATIRSTQDLQLFSGVSPVARTGDSFSAQFTVRNASDRRLEVNFAGAVQGLSSKPPPQKLTLGPGDGRTVDWPIVVPNDATSLKYEVNAAAASGPSDHLLISQSIVPAVPVRTWQATLVRVDQPISQAVSIPAGALVGRGGLQVRLSPSMVAGRGGIEAWMRAYPYVCMEQRVSRAVALHDPALWQGIVADLPLYTDSDGFVKYFPAMTEGSDVLTSYLLAIANEAGLTVPKQSTMETALINFVEGKVTRDEPFAVADLPIRKLAAIEALSRYNKANASLVSSLRIDPNLWPDSAVIDWWSILERTQSLPRRAERLDEAERIMRARLNQQGTSMQLSSNPRDDMWWLMVSPATNMVRLALLLLDAHAWHDDLPKIVQGALALRQKGAWPSTIANAWGSLALTKFADAFEATQVSGISTAGLGNRIDKLDWTSAPQGGSFDFAWPPTEANLQLSHSGAGTPWAEILTSAAIPIATAFSSGYTISKSLSAVDGTHRGQWKQGDLVRVHLTINAQADMTWVVVDDPIPAGASHLGLGLARESQIATAGENENNQNFLWPAYVERAFTGFRAYYDYVPKGTFEVEYTIRLNQPGLFQLPPTHVEALYEPAMLGELPNPPFAVAP
ncbi:MAG TPA: MG2 domain-containing protein [Candidatus Binataceae bacterium]|nr:MG2 domain-containing protein [Candidatus Binataceae bacterium]